MCRCTCLIVIQRRPYLKILIIGLQWFISGCVHVARHDSTEMYLTIYPFGHAS